MRMRVSLLFLVILFIAYCYCESSEEEGYFTVVANKLLRLNRLYRVSIQHQGYKNTKILQIGVVHDKFKEYKNVTLLGDGDEKAEFMLTSRHAGDYKLEVKSMTGDNFESTKRIEVAQKQFVVFIQTDKSIYKPADKIQFRVLVLDDETRPYDSSKVEIFITDGGDNRVKQFENPKFVKGVFQNELQLSDLPVMGKWKIHVKVDGQMGEEKSFKVAEYVLPKFEFSIDANRDANFKDGKIRATVKAKYTFGKIAKGNATITAEENKIGWSWNRGRKTTKSVEVDGKAHVEFDIKNELGIMGGYYGHTVDLFATFTEELSGKEQNATAKVTIHTTPHKMELEKSGEKFKPGLPYKVTAIVKYHDKNMHVTDAQNPVKFIIENFETIRTKCSYPYRHFDKFERREYDCDRHKSDIIEKMIYLKSGIAELDLDVSPNTTKISIEAKYLDTVKKIYNIQKAESESNQFIQVKLLTKKPKINSPINIEVRGTENLNRITYQVIGGGSIVESKTISVRNSKQAEISFTATEEMAPKSNIVIYYIASNGEIISDNIKIELESELKNSIELKISSHQAKPGENVDLTVTTKSDSFVGVLGVDQSVLILKKGNDIEMSKVAEELNKFNIGNEKYDSKNSYKDFKKSDAIIMTNANTEYEKIHYMPYAYYAELNAPQLRGFGFRSGSFSSSLSSANAAASPQSFDGSMNFAHNRHKSIIDEPLKNRSIMKPIEVRKEFPETWLFESFEFSVNETSKLISTKAPDTITSWIITGFSVNPTYGLGISKEALALNVFQPFFVSTTLPYSIKRGEVIAIPITVFNYMQNDQEVDIKFFNTDRQFEFVEVNEEENEVNNRRRKRGLELERTKKVFVKSNEGTTTKFMIRSLKVGYITIKVTAESNIAGDGVEQKLLVVPEGVTQFKNEAVLIDMRNNSAHKTLIDITVPNDAVENSTRIEAAVSGDLLGPSIENLDKLIKLPSGCGEQNMVKFVPNIVVLDYLNSVDKLTPAIGNKAIKHLETGYQRELSYKHDDGSYSAFGKSDSSGSTWLTAFVIKSFNQASKYIQIDKDIIDQGLKFLSKIQNVDGSFPEIGRILSSSMQGGSSKGIALTAYVLSTFLEYEDQDKYKNTIEKGISNILENMDSLSDTYSLTIAAYTAYLCKYQSCDSAKAILFEKLISKSVNENQMKYWMRNSTTNTKSPSSINIEMTAYALQTFIEAGEYAGAFSIGKWLTTQRNENGGFQSTQDTVVGLQALAKLASKISTGNVDMKIDINTEDKQLQININAGNSLILQKFELPSNSRSFDIAANGYGVSLLQIAYRYNIYDSLKRPQFTLEPKIEPASHKEYLHLTVCTKFVPDSYSAKSNMAVMEVTLPSGFTFDTDHMKELKSFSRVKKVETKDSDTIVIVYFDDIDTDEICPEFKAYRTHGVAKQKPSPIIIYDYYDNSRHARVFYNPPEISLCDICGNEDECRKACESNEIEIVS